MTQGVEPLVVTGATYNNRTWVGLQAKDGSTFVISRQRYLDHENACRQAWGPHFTLEHFWKDYFTSETPGIMTLWDAKKIRSVFEVDKR